jgi:hypothetical protein
MSEHMTFLPKKDVLTLEELDRLCSLFIATGVKKIRKLRPPRVRGSRSRSPRGVDVRGARLCWGVHPRRPRQGYPDLPVGRSLRYGAAFALCFVAFRRCRQAASRLPDPRHEAGSSMAAWYSCSGKDETRAAGARWFHRAQHNGTAP